MEWEADISTATQQNYVDGSINICHFKIPTNFLLQSK